jgi:uncharacterized protein YbaR (Trm112 family)
MDAVLLEILACPKCHARLEFKGRMENSEITEGALFCVSCKKNYLIKLGIPNFAE